MNNAFFFTPIHPNIWHEPMEFIAESVTMWMYVYNIGDQCEVIFFIEVLFAINLITCAF